MIGNVLIFEWNNIKILDNEPSYHKRLISEMMHIKKQHKGFNTSI